MPDPHATGSRAAKTKRCYFCERKGTRGYILVEGMTVCANLDACNERSYRAFRKKHPRV